LPKEGRHKTLNKQFIHWSYLGVFDYIFTALVGEDPKAERIIDQPLTSKDAPDGRSPFKKG
jgi:hypothetical protein